MNASVADRGGSTQDYVLLLARILMASIFLVSAMEKIFYFDGVVAFATSFGWPLARPLMPLAIALEGVGGILLLIGWRCRTVALVFVVWIIVLGIWFHRFWLSPPEMWQTMFDAFFHHLVMAGGFLVLAVHGPGALSIDARSDSKVA